MYRALMCARLVVAPSGRQVHSLMELMVYLRLYLLIFNLQTGNWRFEF